MDVWFLVWKRVMQRRRLRRRRVITPSLHYLTHREMARKKIHERLAHWNIFYNFPYNRVAIRDQRTRWGSCSAKHNLNFNYRILFLSERLQDYIIVHELCHLKHMNHSSAFWAEIARAIPDHNERRDELMQISMHELHTHTQIL